MIPIRTKAALVLCAIALSCERPDDPSCAQTTLVIASNKELVHRTGGDLLHYRQGELVITAYVNGMLTLNGRPLQQPTPEKLLPVERLRRLYGEIPFIQEHLAANPLPDSTLRWNQAYQAMVQARRQLSASAQGAFNDARGQGLSLDEAAGRAAAILAENQQLVSSVRPAPVRLPDVPSPHRMLIVHWRGSYDGERYEFPDPPRPRAVQAGDTISVESACALVRTLHGILEEDNGIAGRVELSNGNIKILGEGLTLLAREEEGR